MKKNKTLLVCVLCVITSIANAQEKKFLAEKGDTKEEACENSEWKARKNCIRLGTLGIPAGGVQCLKCDQTGVYQWACVVEYICM